MGNCSEYFNGERRGNGERKIGGGGGVSTGWKGIVEERYQKEEKIKDREMVEEKKSWKKEKKDCEKDGIMRKRKRWMTSKKG